MKHLYFLNPEIRHPKPKLPPDPFYNPSEVEVDYALQRIARKAAEREGERADYILIGIIGGALLLLLALVIAFAPAIDSWRPK